MNRKAKNNTLRNFVWIIVGIILMAITVIAPTTISDDSISITGFSQEEDTNASLRFTIRNLNAGTNATSVISALNDIGGAMSIGIGSSNFVLGTTDSANITAVLSRSRGDTVFANFFNESFIWLNNPSDDNDAMSLIEVMRISPSGMIGIGTTNPINLLHVEGSSVGGTSLFVINDTTSDDSGEFAVFIDGDGDEIFGFDKDGTGNGVLDVRNANGISIARLHTNGNSYLVGGSLGIGVSTPDSTLEVAGSIHIQDLEGTYSNGEAFVCVFNNGTIFAKDSACI